MESRWYKLQYLLFMQQIFPLKESVWSVQKELYLLILICSNKNFHKNQSKSGVMIDV